MLCQECQANEATIQIISSLAGKKTKKFLCEHCARQNEEIDFTFETQFSLHKIFTSLLAQGLAGNRESLQAAKVQCPSCGLSFTQFSQVGRLGCSSCYKAFDESLQPILRRIQAGLTHTGKVPVRAGKRVKYLKEIDHLREELQAKVQKEEFEDAALLRDRIKSLENNLEKEMKHNANGNTDSEDQQDNN